VKQVVVRGEETIIVDLLASQTGVAQSGSPAYSPAASQPAQPAVTEKNYSLKKRVANAVSREEKALISEVLNRTNWNRRKAAEILEISYRSLLYKIKEYGLNEMK
jgi:transcriptional regulator with PAS, ATPase and Fis domain